MADRRSWKYNPACITEVEINFTAVAAMQTRVDFEHRHLERLGENAAAVRDMLNSGWGGILDSYGNLVGARKISDPAEFHSGERAIPGSGSSSDWARISGRPGAQSAQRARGDRDTPRDRSRARIVIPEHGTVGATDQPRFSTPSPKIRTQLEPLPLLQALKQLENELGRYRLPVGSARHRF